MIELERVNLSGKQLLVIVIVRGYSNGTMYLDSTVILQGPPTNAVP